MKRKRKIVSLLLVLTLMMAMLPTQIFAKKTTEIKSLQVQTLENEITTPAAIQIVPNKYIGDGYEVEFKVSSKWPGNFNGELRLTNTGEYVFEDWQLQFDLRHEIINLENAILVNQQGNNYIIKGTDKISTILQGEQIIIYFEATYETEIVQPDHYILDKKILGEKIDLENYPKDEETYRIWKEEIIKKLECEQTNSEQDEIKLFASGSTSGSIENEYIKFNYLDGRYGLFTTGGNPDNPNDDNQKLLYGTGSTSYTTVRINGMNYSFSPDIVTRYDNKIIGTKRYGELIVSQHISIISNQYTDRDDVVEFFYTVENTSDIPHDVGIRIMFDTMLGNNDHAPFRLPAIGDVTTETDLSGDEIPEFWQAFDSLTNPNVIAQGTLKLDKSSTPDRVRFTNWGSATSNPWDYIRSSGSSNGDSAVCLYWNEKSVGKDDIFSCKTFYGLSALQQDLRPPLAVALSGATKLEVVKGDDGKEEYSPNPFTVTAYIQNIGTGVAKNTQISLNLPLGMEIVNGTNNVNLGDIPVGTRQHQVSWKVRVAPSAIEKIEKYSVTVTADNTDPKTLEREISIPKIQKTDIKLLLDRGSIKNGNTLNLKFKIVNEGQEIVDLSQLCTRYYYMDESPKVVKQVHCDSAQFNNPYSQLRSNVTTKSIQNITPLRKDANGYIEFGFNALTNKLLPGQEAIISARVNNSTWANMVMINDYSYIGDNTTPSKGYVEWEYMPVYNISNLKNPIWGIEPPVDNIKLEPELLVEFKPDAIGGKNYMNLGIRITNRGLKPMDLGELDIKYYYTNDNGYPQSVAGHYIGGRIDNRWPNITNKTNVKVIEMDEPKQLADHYVNITFNKDAGTLAYEDYVELNLQVYNTNWLKGDYILENDHSYQTSEMSTFALSPTVSGTPGMTKANNIVVISSTWPFKWGKEPEKLIGTFITLKIGEGSKNEYTNKDCSIFSKGMQTMKLGKDSYSIDNTVKENGIFKKINFNRNTLKAIFASDIAYISGHGYRGGFIPIFNTGEDRNHNYYDYTQYLTASISTPSEENQFPIKTTPNNIFSLDIKDNVSLNIDSNLKWLIFGACSQLNYNYGNNNDSTCLKWIEVLKNSDSLHGILGYYGSAPSAPADAERMSRFVDNVKNGFPMTTSWSLANSKDSILNSSSSWAYLCKDRYMQEQLNEVFDSNSNDYWQFIYLYRYKESAESFFRIANNVTYNKKEMKFDEVSNSIDDIVNITINYGLENNILLEGETYCIDVSVVEKDTFDKEGGYLTSQFDECILKFTKQNDSSMAYLAKLNDEITSINFVANERGIRYYE